MLKRVSVFVLVIHQICRAGLAVGVITGDVLLRAEIHRRELRDGRAQQELEARVVQRVAVDDGGVGDGGLVGVAGEDASRRGQGNAAHCILRIAVAEAIEVGAHRETVVLAELLVQTSQEQRLAKGSVVISAGIDRRGDDRGPILIGVLRRHHEVGFVFHDGAGQHAAALGQRLLNGLHRERNAGVGERGTAHAGEVTVPVIGAGTRDHVHCGAGVPTPLGRTGVGVDRELLHRRKR